MCIRDKRLSGAGDDLATAFGAAATFLRLRHHLSKQTWCDLFIIIIII